MYRVFVHVYIHHFDKLVSVGAVRVVIVSSHCCLSVTFDDLLPNCLSFKLKFMHSAAFLFGNIVIYLKTKQYNFVLLDYMFAVSSLLLLGGRQ